MYLRSIIDNVVVSCATQDVKVSSVLSKVKAEIFIIKFKSMNLVLYFKIGFSFQNSCPFYF